MRRETLTDLAAFVAVAEEASFTRAAGRMGLAQSTLSNTITALEARLGLRLLARTTRSVSLTEAGQHLFANVRPALQQIDAGIEALNGLRHGLGGNIRITTTKNAASSVLLPTLVPFLASHPGVTVEVDVDDAFTDIVAKGFDAGIRFGEQVERDMVAVPIGGNARPAVVATPDYFERFGKPQSPRDLDKYDCVRYRHAGSGHLYRWEFSKKGKRIEVTVNGAMVVNDGDILVQAALAGRGLAYTFEHYVRDHLKSGALIRVLEDWCLSIPGYYLYYPSRQKTPALTALVEALQRNRFNQQSVEQAEV